MYGVYATKVQNVFYKQQKSGKMFFVENNTSLFHTAWNRLKLVHDKKIRTFVVKMTT